MTEGTLSSQNDGTEAEETPNEILFHKLIHPLNKTGQKPKFVWVRVALKSKCQTVFKVNAQMSHDANQQQNPNSTYFRLQNFSQISSGPSDRVPLPLMRLRRLKTGLVPI